MRLSLFMVLVVVAAMALIGQAIRKDLQALADVLRAPHQIDAEIVVINPGERWGVREAK